MQVRTEDGEVLAVHVHEAAVDACLACDNGVAEHLHTQRHHKSQAGRSRSAEAGGAEIFCAVVLGAADAKKIHEVSSRA